MKEGELNDSLSV